MLKCALLVSIYANSAASETMPVTFKPVATIPMQMAREVIFHGNHALVAQNLNGMTAIDISNRDKPELRHQFPPEQIQPMAFASTDDNTLVIADRFRGLVIWNLADIDKPTSLSQLSLPGIATHLDVYKQGDRRMAAIACGGEGVTICDITDLTSPTITGRFRVNVDYSRRVRVLNSVAFLADNFDGGMKLLSLQPDRNPELLLKVGMRGFCDSVFVTEKYACAAYRQYGWRIFSLDFQEPKGEVVTTPTVTLLSTIVRKRNRVRDFAVQDDLLFVADDLAGIEAYDMRNPALPILVGEHSYTSRKETAMSCRVSDNHLYVPSWDGGLKIFRIQDSR